MPSHPLHKRCVPFLSALVLRSRCPITGTRRLLQVRVVRGASCPLLLKWLVKLKMLEKQLKLKQLLLIRVKVARRFRN